MPERPDRARPEIVAGRYALHRRIASGGMASVYLGRVFGHAGFSRVVAIKRLHPQFASDPAFVAALLDEARLASRIRHPNVVPVLDVVEDGEQVMLVMEYVHGTKLSTLTRHASERRQRVPLPIVTALISDVLRGLHAAHEARAPDGTPLELVHRDVSPQNILVSSEGTAQIVDFGIAKALGRSQTTREGQIKGKLAYMALEQLNAGDVTRRTDVCATSIVLWEMVSGERLYSGDSDAQVYAKIMQQDVPSLSSRVPDLPPALEAVAARGLAGDPRDRFATALEMAEALEAAVRPATRAEIAAWLGEIAGEELAARAVYVSEVERWEPDADPPAESTDTNSSEEPLPAEATQMSTMGVSRPATHPARRSRRTLGAGLLAIVAMIGAAIWLGTSSLGRPQVSVLRTVAHGLSPLPKLAPSTAPAASSAPPAESARPASTRPRSTATPRPVRRAPTKTREPDRPCKYRDADGIWHIRPGCL